MASRDQQGPDQAPRGVQAQRDRTRARFRVRGRRGSAAQQAALMDGSLAERRSLPGGRRLLQRGVRGHSVHPAAGTAEARRTMGSVPRHRRLVGTHARAAIGQGRDLRSHVRSRLGPFQEPCARPLAEGAGLVEGGMRRAPNCPEPPILGEFTWWQVWKEGKMPSNRRTFMKLAGTATAVAAASRAAAPAAAQANGQFKAIKALAFDAYGTLFDVFSVTAL